MVTPLEWTLAKREILYNAIFRSLTEYGSLAYFEKLRKSDIRKLKSLQRRILIGVISAYKSVSYTATYVISEKVSLDLHSEEINKTKRLQIDRKKGKLTLKQTKEEIKSVKMETIKEWKTHINMETTGRRTVKLIPKLECRLKNKNLKSNFFLTQYLTGHGKFASYSKEYKIIENNICRECNETEDTPDHTFKECSKFKYLREKYEITEEKLGQCFGDGDIHNQIKKYAREVIEEKREIN